MGLFSYVNISVRKLLDRKAKDIYIYIMLLTYRVSVTNLHNYHTCGYHHTVAKGDVYQV